MLSCARQQITLARSRRAFHVALPRRREPFDPATVERISEDVDVCIVGAGPAGLSAAIRLKQLEQEKGKNFRVVVLEKGGEVGSSITCHPLMASLTVAQHRIAYRLWSRHRAPCAQRAASELVLEG